MDKDAKQERLKQALRENLKRRKMQARQRSASEPAPSGDREAEPDDSGLNDRDA